MVGYPSVAEALNGMVIGISAFFDPQFKNHPPLLSDQGRKKLCFHGPFLPRPHPLEFRSWQPDLEGRPVGSYGLGLAGDPWWPYLGIMPSASTSHLDLGCMNKGLSKPVDFLFGFPKQFLSNSNDHSIHSDFELPRHCNTSLDYPYPIRTCIEIDLSWHLQWFRIFSGWFEHSWTYL